MNKLTYTQEQFNEAFKSAKPVAFQLAWKNGTGYLDGSAYQVFEALEPSDRFCFMDDFGRRGVGVIVANGHNLVVFERYAPEGEERSKVFVSNVSRQVKNLLDWKEGSVSADEMVNISECISLNAFGRACVATESAKALLAAM